MKNTALGPRSAPAADPADLGAAAKVLAALRDAPEPLRIGDIAHAVGAHDNTVRGHLVTLMDRGLVTSSTVPAQGRGRPAALYSAGPRPGARTDEYRALAGAFAADLLASGSGTQVRERARLVGRTWGERLAPEASAGDAPGSLDATLADLGFGPERDGELVRLTTCPLLDLAVENPDVICRVHLGLVDGLLDRGAEAPETELTPFAEPGACLLLVPEDDSAADA